MIKMEFILIRLNVNGYITTQMRKIKNYYFSVNNYIPAQTLRGAILAEYYYQKGKIDYNFYSSPAYPVDTAPAHYFSPAINRKSKIYVERKGVLKEKDKEELDMTLEEKPKIGNLITLRGEDGNVYKYTEFVPETIIQMHVGIDKQSASNYIGMLYAYEYKKFDKMWALVSAESDVIDNVSEIKVGRGRNRNGNIVKIEKVKRVELQEPEGLSYCLSPIVPKLFGKEFLRASYIIGEETIYSGWFTDKNISGQKPTFKAVKEGSLVYVKERKEFEKLFPAGLNFIFKIQDLKTLLDKVRV